MSLSNNNWEKSTTMPHSNIPAPYKTLFPDIAAMRAVRVFS
jgi:hypothetical protein